MAPSAPKPGNTHNDPARAATYSAIASEIAAEHGSVSNDDCAKCDGCDDAIWDGKTYPDYVMERYGDLGELPPGFDVDWDTDLAGSAAGGRGKVVVISTGKSDWERDHVVSGTVASTDSRTRKTRSRTIWTNTSNRSSCRLRPLEQSRIFPSAPLLQSTS